jgi:DNA-binding response OmpR family regulator
VTATTDGEEAYKKAQKILPDLILLDVRMPRMNGYDACKKIKANERTQHIPVVFLSAKGQEAEVQTGIDAGATEYIIKPFSPDQLTERVQAILRNHKQT